MVQWESKLELYAFYLFDADRGIPIFSEQAAKLWYWLDGELHWHVPDTLVTGHAGRRFVEIKDREEINDPFVRRRAALLTTALAIQGIGYELLGEDEIRREPRLSNAMQMVKFGRKAIRDMDRERLRRLIENTGQLAWGEILDGVAGPYGVFQIARLILEGELDFDYECDWTSDTIIRPSRQYLGGDYGR